MRGMGAHVWCGDQYRMTSFQKALPSFDRRQNVGMRGHVTLYCIVSFHGPPPCRSTTWSSRMLFVGAAQSIYSIESTVAVQGIIVPSSTLTCHLAKGRKHRTTRIDPTHVVVKNRQAYCGRTQPYRRYSTPRSYTDAPPSFSASSINEFLHAF